MYIYDTGISVYNSSCQFLIGNVYLSFDDWKKIDVGRCQFLIGNVYLS